MIVTDKQVQIVSNFLGGTPVYKAGKHNAIYAMVDGQAIRVAHIGVSGNIVFNLDNCKKAANAA